MGIYNEKCGFGKRKTSITENKKPDAEDPSFRPGSISG